MSTEVTAKESETLYPDSSLIYDTDAISLIGRFSDELSAYRSRRKWVEILSNYFLLEPERDFESKIISSETSDGFLLHCNFTSACGRYAFWRLINHQAPEAEEKLAEPSIKDVPALGLESDKNEGPWVLAGLSLIHI